PDGADLWAETINSHFKRLHKEAATRLGFEQLADLFKAHSGNIRTDLTSGELRMVRNAAAIPSSAKALESWYHDELVKVWLNHETRGHMSSDLYRYAYAAAFARIYDRSPKGHTEFQLEGLTPNHQNWESGKFSDRFRVQLHASPATTITSHISKD